MENKKSKGLGDTIEKITKATGIKKVVDTVSKAVELGILKLSSDQRNFMWGSNNRNIMTIPFDEHPYTALAHWFKTDEGMEIYANIEKRLNS